MRSVAFLPKIALFFFLVTLFGNPLFSKEDLPRIYIQSIIPESPKLQKIADSATSSLTLGLLEEGGGKYSFIDDASLASLLRQLGTSLQLGSRSPEFYESIAKSPYHPDFLISGEISGTAQNIRYVVRFLEKPEKSGNSYQLRKTYQFQIKEFQTDFYSKEIAKAFLRKTYTIREQDAPSFEIPKLEFAEIKISEIENQSLSIPTPSIASEGVQSFAQALLEKMDAADAKASQGEWEDSFSQYWKVRQSIERLDPSNRSKIPSIQKRSEMGVQRTRKVLFAKKIQEVDSKISREDISSRKRALDSYKKIRKEYLELPDYSQASDVTGLLNDRITNIILLEESIEESLADKEYSDLQFDSAFKRYETILSRLYEESTREITGKRGDAFRRKIGEKKNIVSRSAVSYVRAKVKGLLEVADAEYSRSLLEREMENPKVARERRALAVRAMEVAQDTFSKTRFSSEELVSEYEALAQKLNSDQGIDLSPTNLLLFVPRYALNVARGISDLFVWKVGYGVGFGTEVGPLGTELSMTSYPVEIRSGYGAYPSPASKLASWENTESERSSTNFGIVYAGVSTCTQLYLIRFCDSKDNKTGEDRSTVWKYTSANFHVALGPAVFVSFEGYRLVELGGVFLLQDWNLSGEGRERTKYFLSERVPEKPAKVQYIFTLDDWPKKE